MNEEKTIGDLGVLFYEELEAMKELAWRFRDENFQLYDNFICALGNLREQYESALLDEVEEIG